MKRNKNRRKTTTRIVSAAILTLAAIAVLLVFAFSRVLVVRDVMVVGNRTILKEEVIAQSGIKPGDQLLGISFSGLKERLESNRYIQYEGFEFDYKGTITIHIRERMGMAVINHLGYYYVLDSQGMVLENAGLYCPENMVGPIITGMKVDNSRPVIIGDYLPVSNPLQLEKMTRLLSALDRTNMLARTSQMDLTSFDNLFLLTQDGTKIILGDETNLETKIRIAEGVLEDRESIGDLKGAKIDVSSGRKAHFIPPVLPTVTPVPTSTPTISPSSTPRR